MSDQTARAAAARDALYEQMAREFGLLTADEADKLLGSSVRSARAGGRLLGLEWPRPVFPGFQFDGASIRPFIAELIAMGAEHGRTEQGLVQWLVSPTTYLHGKRPVDVLDDPAVVLEAARSAFGVVW